MSTNLFSHLRSSEEEGITDRDRFGEIDRAFPMTVMELSQADQGEESRRDRAYPRAARSRFECCCAILHRCRTTASREAWLARSTLHSEAERIADLALCIPKISVRKSFVRYQGKEERIPILHPVAR